MKYLTLLLTAFFLLSCEDGVSTPKSKDTTQTSLPLDENRDTTTPSDVYAGSLSGNLLTLNGTVLDPISEFKKPSKYYLFYKTASWCPPCQKFTPSLVSFYNDHKAIYGDDFEIILISSDRKLKDMENYAVNKKMAWPHLALSEVKAFNKSHPFPGKGIPNTILTDISGNIIETSYSKNGQYKGPHIPVQKLQALLASD